MAKILIADDRDLYLLAYKDILRDEGHDVVSTNNGLAAIEAIRSSVRFDVVITDFKMPGADGREVALAARERGIERVFINTCMPPGKVEPVPGVEIVDKMDFHDLDSRVLQPLKKNGSQSK